MEGDTTCKVQGKPPSVVFRYCGSGEFLNGGKAHGIVEELDLPCPFALVGPKACDRQLFRRPVVRSTTGLP